ncbi:MAG: hypothetical protein QXI36_02060 [Candidatus Bathyarchaeia archaeon]
MPRRKSIVQQAQESISDSNWWLTFLKSRGLISETALAPPSSLEAQEGQLNQDMITFAYRVAERLTPLNGLDAQARARALKVRERFRKELENVFLGHEDFQNWFNRTRSQLGLHLVDFTQIIYESLQGLKSPEARELRKQYGETLTKLKSLYSV